MTKPEDSSEASAPKHRVAFVVIAAVLLLVLYVLSCGPVAWIFIKTGLFQSTTSARLFEIIYAPLEWAYRHSDCFKSFINAYFKLLGVPP